MKYLLSLLAFSFLTISQAQDYWQQKVDYNIEVALNDKSHELNGKIQFVYTNNSPDALTFLYIHLWPNAYKNRKTALAKQNYQNGNDILFYGNDSLKGFIDQLDFKINGEKATWSLDEENIDIAKVLLTNPLKPGESLTLSTPFHVKIPSGRISRLGHIDESYQITQWYPKPAVYDRSGWHAFPYLNQGEFYSEYGSYDVSITLPKNYVVGATGDLQTGSEIDFMNERAKLGTEYVKNLASERDNSFPASASEMKTIRFKQKDVHDFAWFADKRYIVLKSAVTLPQSKREVTSWALFTPKNAGLWANAPEYINDGTYYYSLWNGDYPYNQVTAVDGTISAGGGMEYPNVTVIGNSGSKEELEIVIVHEVGHNWFYGILGSNERDHGWMDEGMNTLNEIRYIQTKYPGNTRLSDMVLNGRFHMNDLDYHDQADFQYQLIARLGDDQPIETKSPDFTSINYGIIMYQKTGLVFHYLKSYLGDAKFDECMHAYYDQWHFKHPYPEDMKVLFEKTSGKDLSWIFGDLIQTRKHVDYKIKSVRQKNGLTTIAVRNVGQVNGPIPVTLTKDSVSETIWFEPSDKRTRKMDINKEVDLVQIDPTNHIPEVNRSNNTWRKKGLFGKLEPLKMEFLVGDNEPSHANLFWSPAVAYNVADQLMLGAVVHNYGLPFKPLTFYVAPLYSINRQMVSGQGDIQYVLLPSGCINKVRFGTGVRSYKTEKLGRNDANFYAALTPYVGFQFKNYQKDSKWQNELAFKGLVKLDVLQPKDQQKSLGFAAIYTNEYSHPNHRWSNEIRHEVVNNLTSLAEVSRTSISSTYQFRYARKKNSKWAEIRLFAGKIWSYYQPSFSDTYRYSLSGASGDQDLFYEQLSFNRGSYLQSSQVRAENMGGFKSVSSYGSTKDWMVSSNLYVDLPFLPSGFGVYANGGMFSNGFTNIQSWDMGIGWRFRKIARVYFPIAMESSLANSLSQLSYLQKIRFTLNFNIIHRAINLKTIL